MTAQSSLHDQLERALAAHRGGDLEQAEAQYRRILRVRPRQFDATHLLGMIEFARGNFSEAQRRLDAALAINPASAEAYSNRSAVHLALGKAEHALVDADRSIKLVPTFSSGHVNRGNALLAVHNAPEALIAYDAAISLDVGLAEAWSGRSVALLRLGRAVDAIASARRSLQLNTGLADGWSNLGQALHELGDLSGASSSYEEALAINPKHPDARYNRGIMRHTSGDFAGALEDLVEACRFKRFDGDAGQILHTRMNVCDWDGVEEAREQLARSIRSGQLVSVPFSTLTLFDDPRLSQIAARAYSERRHPSQPAVWRSSPASQDRIHVAYVSADFRDHPVSYLLIDTLERHDKTRFRITAISTGPRDEGPMGARVRAACDETIDATGMSDDEVASWIARAGVEVLVDLMGHTGHARPGILARRPAPVQVNFLGYPGTMGAPYVDYIIADRVVAPDTAFYDEKVCYLPDTYQPTSVLPLLDEPPTRHSQGLPDDALVFSSFCNNWKITPDVFAVWMRLLQRVDQSVVWLLANNVHVQTNLRKSAEKAGVDSNRIVFAPRVDHATHITRQKLSDLALDTFPYGAHTTASDAIRVGLPIVTRSGASFYSRVARSILKAADLEAYAVDTIEAYEELALDLALNPQRLAEARRDFGRAEASRLFDTDRYAAKLEEVFEVMSKRSRAGLPPEAFAISD